MSFAASLAACSSAPAEDPAVAAGRVRAAEAAKAKARDDADAAREVDRLKALWTYHDIEVDNGRQRSASMYSMRGVDTDGQGNRSVQLVFRDHPSWGRSSYLVLQAGDFNCYNGCRVTATVDDAPPKRMAARRPPTDEAIAMFINDARGLWRLLDGAKQVSIEFPVRASAGSTGGTRTASFEVSGLDRTKMPEWDAAARGGKRP